MAKKKTEQVTSEVSVEETEVCTVGEEVKAEKVPVLSAVDRISKFIFHDVNALTRRPPNRLLRTSEDVEERKVAAQARRDKRNAKRLQQRG